MSNLNNTLKSFTLSLYQKSADFQAWYIEMSKEYPENYPECPSVPDLIDAYREWILEGN